MSSPTSAPPTQCKICDREFKDSRMLSLHVVRTHKVSSEDYYNTYINKNIDTCFTCGSSTTFTGIVQGYNKFCSRACSNQNLELMEQRVIRTAITHQKDPSIRQNAGKKLTKTLKDNPDIKIRAAKKFKETIKANPEIKINASKKCAETLRQNPNITKLQNHVYHTL